jgi:hypothetical protein
MGSVRAVPRLCELYPGICITTEEKHGKTFLNYEHKLDLSIYLPCKKWEHTFCILLYSNKTKYRCTVKMRPDNSIRPFNSD